ncbi:MAG: alpha/beta hydrolase [Rhodospirillaceae bacterium]|jgi:2-hydroxy-6-oxonona-2,4-dienedioate hydrolase|nr:alpha/beta hydrolase [Rhodospirillaceae bacterium]MBT5459883.1 alpha/beta hydrolase [Rhodospirillaceae bacterium]
MPMNDRKFIDVDGVRTCYYEKGDGPLLVLFHGGNFGSNDAADCALDWGLNFDGLAEKYHVFAIDKLGQGYTGNPKSDGDYTMAAAVRHGSATLDALGIQNAHLVGHSRGGYLTCRMTMERPDLVRTCTIIDSNSCAPGIGLNEIVLAAPPEPRLTAESQRWIMEHYSYSPAHVSDEWIDGLVEVGQQESYQEGCRKMSAGGDGLRHTLFLPNLAKDKIDMFAWIRDHGMDRPTQLIWGYNDPTAPIEMGRALYDMIAARERQAQLNVFNESGHFTYREHPTAFNACLHAFIEGAQSN